MDAQKFWIRVLALGLIEVTRSGVVTTVTGKITKGTENRDGYLSISMYDPWEKRPRSISLHRLVWLRFKGRIPKGKEINHDDGVKSNNHINNLELTTRSGNMKHAYAMGLAKATQKTRGEASARSKLTDKQVVRLRRMWAKAKTRGEPQLPFAKKHTKPGMTYWCVLYAIRGTRYKNVAM